MPATYQVNGRQFVVLPVAQANGTFPASFSSGAAGAAGQAREGAPAAGAAPGGQPGAAGGRQGRGGGPVLPGAYMAFALPQ